MQMEGWTDKREGLTDRLTGRWKDRHTKVQQEWTDLQMEGWTD